MFIYLDHNIIDGIAKKYFSFKPSTKITWIYSDENFDEIKRSQNMQFLEVLNDLKAQKMELILDESFRITGRVRFLPFINPSDLYEKYVQATSEVNIDNTIHYEFLSRLYGADNKEEILNFPASFKTQVEEILSPYGLFTGEFETRVNQISDNIEKIVSEDMHKIGHIEDTRQGIGTDKGRLSNLANDDNPLEQIWDLVKDKVGNLTIDQFFGFDPLDKQNYTEWPIYLGIIGCHTVLNFLGFKPDRSLSKVGDIPGILSDGSHIANAAYCHGLLSKDKRLCIKAKAIYKYKNIGTVVTQL
jgi:hypothetical protein